MGLLPEPEMTDSDISREEQKNLNRDVDGIMRNCVVGLENAFNRFWNNPRRTPQQMSDAYGTLAKDIFVKLAIFQAAMKEVDDSYQVLEVPDKYSYVSNDDGTVTITDISIPEEQEITESTTTQEEVRP